MEIDSQVLKAALPPETRSQLGREGSADFVEFLAGLLPSHGANGESPPPELLGSGSFRKRGAFGEQGDGKLKASLQTPDSEVSRKSKPASQSVGSGKVGRVKTSTPTLTRSLEFGETTELTLPLPITWDAIIGTLAGSFQTLDSTGVGVPNLVAPTLSSSDPLSVNGKSLPPIGLPDAVPTQMEQLSAIVGDSKPIQVTVIASPKPIETVSEAGNLKVQTSQITATDRSQTWEAIFGPVQPDGADLTKNTSPNLTTPPSSPIVKSASASEKEPPSSDSVVRVHRSQGLRGNSEPVSFEAPIAASDRSVKAESTGMKTDWPESTTDSLEHSDQSDGERSQFSEGDSSSSKSQNFPSEPLRGESSGGNSPKDDSATIRETVARQDRHQTLRETAQRMELFHAANSRDGVVVRVDPNDAGPLTLIVKPSREGGVQAEISTQDERLQHALQDHKPQLTRQLESKGYSSADVSVRRDMTDSHPRHHAPSESPRPLFATKATERPVSTSESTTPRRPATKSGRVDLWI